MRSPSIRTAVTFSLLILAPACRSFGSNEPGAPEPYIPRAIEEPSSIGFFLADYDASLRRWNELKLNPSNDRDLRMLRALETSLAERAIKRQGELVGEVETGPPTNRGVAAVALGFTGDPAVLSPLLNALSDPNPSVVQKALLGIGILELPETPCAQPIHLLQNDPDPWTRSNAAYALLRIATVGGRDPDLASACRRALIDEEPGVRAQAASILGVIEDPDSVEMLGDLMHDETKLVIRAAMKSLAHIGRENAEQKGDVARLLVNGLEHLDRVMKRVLLAELMLLAGRDLGKDTGPWREWAYRMP